MKDTTHFEKTFYFICGTSFIVLMYVILITFFAIPKENQRFVDIALAFLLGFISANASYLTGGNPSQRKAPEGTTTVEANITTTTQAADENK